MTDTRDPEAVVPESLKRSGFPFQTAVAEVIGRTPSWDVATQEFPWRDELGKDRFLDLVAESTTGVILTIEAKKTDKEIFTFLLPEPARNEEQRARILDLRELTKPEDTIGARLEMYCDEWWLRPESVESAFCVVSTSATGRDSRLLEADAQLLIRGTEAYAFRERQRYVFRQNQPRAVQPVIPVIVTNAQLFVARYEPRKVSLETGQFSEIPPHTAVSVVRFRKAFLSHQMIALGERTVLVVNGDGLDELLRVLVERPGRYESSTNPYPYPR